MSSADRSQVKLHVPGFPQIAIVQNAPMSRVTTWRIGGPADFLARVATPEQLAAAVRWGRAAELPVHVIGGGSNLLVSDEGLRGLVVVSKTPGQNSESLVAALDEESVVRVRVGAQAPLSWFGRYASERGWAGMDWGVGLPGTIGGATVNNAGAHGAEQKDTLSRVRILDQSGNDHWLDAEWLESSYRHTIIKDQPQPRDDVVLEVEFLLAKGDAAELERLADEHAAYRKATQPTGRCAGSTFTNPENDYAGRLLEVSGLKGFGLGGVQFSTVHSNFIVNDGSGTAAEVVELIALARKRVFDQHGITLKPEIEVLGLVPGWDLQTGE